MISSAFQAVFVIKIFLWRGE